MIQDGEIQKNNETSIIWNNDESNVCNMENAAGDSQFDESDICKYHAQTP